MSLCLPIILPVLFVLCDRCKLKYQVKSGVPVLVSAEAIDLTRRVGAVELDGASAKLLGSPGDAFPGLEKALRRAAIALSAEMMGGAASALDQAVVAQA